MISLKVNKSETKELFRYEKELEKLTEFRLPRWAYLQSEWLRDGLRITWLKRKIRKLRDG